MGFCFRPEGEKQKQKAVRQFVHLQSKPHGASSSPPKHREKHFCPTITPEMLRNNALHCVDNTYLEVETWSAISAKKKKKNDDRCRALQVVVGENHPNSSSVLYMTVCIGLAVSTSAAPWPPNHVTYTIVP